MNREKCVDEVLRGIRDYRDYKYCDKFLDAMSQNAEEIVSGLEPYIKTFDEIRETILHYVYCACTGLENAEGYPETIISPSIAFTTEGVLAALGIKK